MCGISNGMDGGTNLGVLVPPVAEILVQPETGDVHTGAAMGRGGAIPRVRNLEPPFVASWNSRAWGSPSLLLGKASVQRGLSTWGVSGYLQPGRPRDMQGTRLRNREGYRMWDGGVCLGVSRTDRGGDTRQDPDPLRCVHDPARRGRGSLPWEALVTHQCRFMELPCAGVLLTTLPKGFLHRLLSKLGRGWILAIGTTTRHARLAPPSFSVGLPHVDPSCVGLPSRSPSSTQCRLRMSPSVVLC